MTEREHRNRTSYSKYDRMSTAELEEILRLDFELPAADELDMDTVLYITEVIARREREAENSSIPNIDIAWNDFCTKYFPNGGDPLLEDVSTDKTTAEQKAVSNTPTKTSRYPIRRRIVRVASIAALLVTLFLVMTATAYAFGYNLWGAIAQWTQDTFSFAIEKGEHSQAAENRSPSNMSLGDTSDLQKALKDHGLQHLSFPTWIPEEFSIDTVYVSEDEGYTDFSVLYTDGDKILILSAFLHKDVPDNFIQWQKDLAVPVVYEAGGISHYMMTNMGRQKAVWLVDTCEYGITGDISKEELILMIDSIYKGV